MPQQRLLREGIILQDDSLFLSYVGDGEDDITKVPLVLVVMPPRREDVIERRARSLLNKISSKNFEIIVEQLGHIELEKAHELEIIIKMIFRKALVEPQHSETYANLVYALRMQYPEFPPEKEGERAQTFTRMLLTTCQNEFESCPLSLDPALDEKQRLPADDLSIEMKRRKDKILAVLKLTGHLFMMHLLAAKVIGTVVHDLIGIRYSLPTEHQIDCVCELLQLVCHTLDSTQHGKLLMSQFVARLMELKLCTVHGGKAAFSKRVQFKIQNLLDLRSKPRIM
jgi:hypothetical protein